MSAFADISNVTLSEYSAFIDDNYSKTKIPKTQNQVILSEREKEELIKTLTFLITRGEQVVSTTKDVFKNNFERWEIVEASSLYSLLNKLINDSDTMSNFILSISKYYKSYPSIMGKMNQLKLLDEEIGNITKKYLLQAKQAQEAHQFMQSFIPKNREVLDALA